MLRNLLTRGWFAPQHVTSRSAARLSLVLGPLCLDQSTTSVPLILPTVHTRPSGLFGVKPFPLSSAAAELAGVGWQGCQGRIWLKAWFPLFHCGIHAAHPTARAKQSQLVKSNLKNSSLPNPRCLDCASSEGSLGEFGNIKKYLY